MRLLALVILSAAALTESSNVGDTINGAYDALDYNFDGRLERRELSQFFTTYDVNNDDRVSFKEYTDAIDENFTHYQNLTTLFRNIFNFCDINENGFVEHPDLDTLFTRCDISPTNSIVTRTEFHDYFADIALGLIIG